MAESVLDLSLVIACYNEEYELADSVRQVVEILESARWSWELIFVDDASRDRTRELIDRLIAQYPDKNFRRLFHDHNTGRGRTVTDGFRLARGRSDKFARDRFQKGWSILGRFTFAELAPPGTAFRQKREAVVAPPRP